jgi:hypothetical protein
VKKSINQIGQESDDTSANEAERIREREASVTKAWRTIAYHEGEAACSAARVAATADLPVDCGLYVSDGRDSYSDCCPGKLTWEQPRATEVKSCAPSPCSTASSMRSGSRCRSRWWEMSCLVHAMGGLPE